MKRVLGAVAALGALVVVAPDAASLERLPTPAEARLVVAVESYAAELGTPIDARARILDAGLDSTTLGGLAASIELLARCTGTITVAGLERCATELEDTGRLLSQPSTSSGDELVLWPVLSYRPAQHDDVVRHDFALSIDGGGNDVYLNNAGGSLLDLVDDPAVTTAAAGCQNLVPDSLARHCVPAAALLVDNGGNDVYGELAEPGADALCTNEAVVRRIATVGVGVAGVGVLLDRAGNDRYFGKTLAIASGHAGVAVVHDERGNDTYMASRNAMGFGLVGGVGTLRDDDGNDEYRFVMAAGGLLNDDGVCDPDGRAMQGTGVLGGSGTLRDLDGNDTYIAPAPIENCHLGPDAVSQVPSACASSGSQGFGSLGGIGRFIDDRGLDRYEGVPGRSDDVTVEGEDGATGFGSFIDKNSRSSA